LRFLGGKEAMIESPVLQKLIAESIHKVILAVLKKRFGTVRRDVVKLLQSVLNEEKLTALTVDASICRDMEAFRQALLA
jgi:hypothetical protein